MKEYSTLLLDLDGTLLDIEVSFFLGPMVEAMYGCFKDIMDMDRFRDALFGSTEAIMVEKRSDGENNKDGFNRAFARLAGLDINIFIDRFDYFYREIFPALTGYGKPVHGALEFVDKAAARGYTLGLATNPIFPTSAIMERMGWAGLDPEIFKFIPGLENMRTCKPMIEYFQDLAMILDTDPSDCLMVGNDMEQDLPATEAGMGTFLVDRHLVSRGRTRLTPDARGTLQDLERLLGW